MEFSFFIGKQTPAQTQWVTYTPAWGTEFEPLCSFGSKIKQSLMPELTEISSNW